MFTSKLSCLWSEGRVWKNGGDHLLREVPVAPACPDSGPSAGLPYLWDQCQPIRTHTSWSQGLIQTFPLTDIYQKCPFMFRIALRVHFFVKYGPCCLTVTVVDHWIPIEIPAVCWVRTRDKTKNFRDQKQEISVLERIRLNWHILAGSGSTSRACQSGSGPQTGSFWHINLYNFQKNILQRGQNRCQLHSATRIFQYISEE